MPQILVAPSLLSADFANLKQEIEAVLSAGADWIHVDVMDGHFVPNLTIGAPVVASLRKATKAPLDVHLMIEKPERFIEDFTRAGSDLLTIHIESTDKPRETLMAIKQAGVSAGITLKPMTPVETIFPFLDIVDMVLIMTVNPGFGGQSFMRDQVPKITLVKKEAERIGRHIHIEVDGGIDDKTAPECIAAGANVLVAGSYIFKNDYAKAIQSLLRRP